MFRSTPQFAPARPEFCAVAKTGRSFLRLARRPSARAFRFSWMAIHGASGNSIPIPKSKRFSNARRFAPGNPGHFRERQYNNEQVSREPLERGLPGLAWLKTGEERK